MAKAIGWSCAGGEPLLQVDPPLIAALHARASARRRRPTGPCRRRPGIDWVCVSPKADTTLVQLSGDELKLVYPQPGVDPARFEHLAFDRFLLQPMDEGASSPGHVRAAVDYCLAHPKWRLSLQTHKLLGLP